MNSTIPLFRTAAAFAAAGIFASCTAVPRLAARPSAVEIHDIEAKATMPSGAASIREYVRYYYASATSRGRTITGMYVARNSLEPSDVPTGEVVVVGSDAEVPAPFDAGCGVVFVNYDPHSASIMSSYCSAELKLWDQ